MVSPMPFLEIFPDFAAVKCIGLPIIQASFCIFTTLVSIDIVEAARPEVDKKTHIVPNSKHISECQTLSSAPFTLIFSQYIARDRFYIGC